MKKVDEALVSHLTRVEMQALLDAPDPRRVPGIRDRAMLHLAFAAGCVSPNSSASASTKSTARRLPAST